MNIFWFGSPFAANLMRLAEDMRSGVFRHGRDYHDNNHDVKHFGAETTLNCFWPFASIISYSIISYSLFLNQLTLNGILMCNIHCSSYIQYLLPLLCKTDFVDIFFKFSMWIQIPVGVRCAKILIEYLFSVQANCQEVVNRTLSMAYCQKVTN